MVYWSAALKISVKNYLTGFTGMATSAQYKIKRVLGLYPWFASVVCIVISLTVMWGWCIQNIVLVKIRSDFAPMHFNTALCFLASSLALLLLTTKRKRAALIWASLSTLLSSVTLVQYIFNVNFGIDNFFVEPFTATRTIVIGRMAPNTACALVALGASLILSSLASVRCRLDFLILLMASLTIALGAVPMIGYISGVEAAYGWENFSQMALTTAFCFIMLGTATFAYGWKKIVGNALWVPLPIGIGLIMITVSMAYAMRVQEHNHLRTIVQNQTHYLAQETEREFTDLQKALKRITKRWKAAGGTQKYLWEDDASAYIDGYPFLDLLIRVDASGTIFWAKTRDSQVSVEQIMQRIGAVSVTSQRKEMEDVRAQNLGFIELTPQQRGYVIAYPLSSGHGKDGTLFAVLNIDTFFKHVLESIPSHYASLIVTEGNTTVFSEEPGQFVDVSWQTDVSLESEYSPNWQLHLKPTTQMAHQYFTRMPWVVFFAGLLSSGLVSLSLFLFLRLRRDGAILKQRKAQLHAVIQNAADGITLIDSAGLIEEFNPACEQLFGYSKEEVMGQNVKMLMPEPYHKEHDGYLGNYQKTGDKKIIGSGREVRGKRKDGTEFDIDLRVSEVRAPKRVLYMGMFRDITERKRMEKIQKQLIEKLGESNAELERFAYVASHDLREPLRLVANFAVLLKRQYASALDAEAKEYITIINDSATRMHSMVGDLLEYARIGNEEMRYSKVDMEEQICRVKYNLSSFIQDHQACVTHDPLPEVMGNALQLMRVLQNLVGNAIKFHANDVSPQVHVGAEKQENCWRFYVKDNGIGMAPEYTQQIFEPFRQLHARNEYMGTGIGLAICKRIVEKHGGTISAESTPGNGSVFYFTILN